MPDEEWRSDPASADLVAAYARAAVRGPMVNAVVNILERQSRRGGAQAPLYGVPVAVKDNVQIAGTPQGNGNPEDMVDLPAAADAPIVASLREAGADVMATTSLLEYAAGFPHPDIPAALNPFDLARTAGGSSGGSAAAVAVGVCPVALGTDTGGSIRVPASFCGVVGFKPSFGVLSTVGVQELAPTLDHVGILGRDVEITRRTFEALTRRRPVQPPSVLRIGVISDQVVDSRLDPEVAHALANCIDALGRAGVRIVMVAGEVFDLLYESWSDISSWEMWRVHGMRVRSNPTHYGASTLRKFQQASATTRSAYEAARRRRDELLPSVWAAYMGVDALLSPATPHVAPLASDSYLSDRDGQIGVPWAVFTRAFNLIGAPALSLPCGWSRDGLPIGLQLSAPPRADRVLLATAAEVESILAVPTRECAVG
ncbi:MAG TPA: amidase [Candidatus Dormibacteraeota bacterium]|nr:amidase [Candidatus Dormibacteraeota bacterium]